MKATSAALLDNYDPLPVKLNRDQRQSNLRLLPSCLHACMLTLFGRVEHLQLKQRQICFRRRLQISTNESKRMEMMKEREREKEERWRGWGCRVTLKCSASRECVVCLLLRFPRTVRLAETNTERQTYLESHAQAHHPQAFSNDHFLARSSIERPPKRQPTHDTHCIRHKHDRFNCLLPTSTVCPDQPRARSKGSSVTRHWPNHLSS